MITSYRAKLLIILLALTIGISSIGLYLAYRLSLGIQTEGLRQRLISIATTSAAMIDTEEHKKIDPYSPLASPSFTKISGILYAVKKANPDVEDLYTMVKTDKPNIWAFGASALEYGRKVFTEAEMEDVEYDVSRFPEMQKAFDGPAADKQLTVDKWGVWLSGYAPIRDETGKAIAMVGVDMSAQKVGELRNQVKIWALYVFGFDVLISLILSTLLANTISRPIRYMAKQTEHIADGDFGISIDIKSHDEINRLAGSFNDMVKKLKSTFEELEDAHQEIKTAYQDTVFRLAMAVEYKDKTTGGHISRVSRYSAGIAKKLGLDKKEVEAIRFGSPMHDMVDTIRYGSPLHDVGKIGIPDAILTKEGKLTPEEFEKIKEHTIMGSKIFKDARSPYLKAAGIISLTHHEKYDGSGYPHGLKGDEIHIFGRIVALADAYDALVSERTYKKAVSQEEALRIIKEESGKHFDPRVVKAFLAWLDEQEEFGAKG